jgi:tetrahydromethanopterin S-methyltransferase subunit G
MEDAHVVVVLEEIRGQFKVFGESLRATNDKIDRLAYDMNDRFDGVDSRLSNVEGRLTNVEGRLSNVEGRLSNVEGRLSNVEGRLSNVEGRLTNMALALNGAPPRRKTRHKSGANS